MKGHKRGHGEIGGEGNQIEADETFVGGITKNMHKRPSGSAEVQGKGPYPE